MSCRGPAVETGILFSIINVITEGLQRTAPARGDKHSVPFRGGGKFIPGRSGRSSSRNKIILLGREG